MILRSNQLPRFHSSLSPCWHFQLSNFCIKSGHVNESRKPLSIQRIQSLRKPLERTNRESPIEKINRESPIEKINRESPLEKFNRESRSSSSGVKSDSFLSKWIENFNCTVAVHADTSLVTYLLFRSATWYALAAIYSQILTVGPELALGYVITRFTGRLRLPFNVGLAAIISNQFPIFGTIQASALLGLMKRNANEAHTEKSPFELQLERFQKWIEGPLDQYGFSYLIASKLNVMVSICGTAYAVKIGLDVSFRFRYPNFYVCHQICCYFL
jgi:hypothetical protein